uniref:EGF-like domain-containing protein n=1 Tax=Trichuris muris TaxID=70415 RepID=A0A5S6QHL2_TRIMR
MKKLLRLHWYMVISTSLLQFCAYTDAADIFKCPWDYGFAGYRRLEIKRGKDVDCVSHAAITFNKRDNESWINHFEQECAKQFHKGRLYCWPMYVTSEADTHHLISHTKGMQFPYGKGILNGMWVSAIRNRLVHGSQQLDFVLNFGQHLFSDEFKSENCHYMLSSSTWASEASNSILCPQEDSFVTLIAKSSTSDICLVLAEEEGGQGQRTKVNLIQCDASTNHFTAMCKHPFIPCIEYGSSGCIRCEKSLSGRFCQIDDGNPCGQFPCGNNGKCVNRQGKAICHCLPGFKGEKCENTIDPCESNPCKNNGSCTTTHGSYACKCLHGFSGAHCSIELDPCKNISCGHGKCQSQHGKAACKCPAEFTGNRCQFEVDPCIPNPCRNNGKCKKHYSSYRCICTKGFTGIHCTKAIEHEIIYEALALVSDEKSNETETAEFHSSRNLKIILLITIGGLLLLALTGISCYIGYKAAGGGQNTSLPSEGHSWSSWGSFSEHTKRSSRSSRSIKSTKMSENQAAAATTATAQKLPNKRITYIIPNIAESNAHSGTLLTKQNQQ